MRKKVIVLVAGLALITVCLIGNQLYKSLTPTVVGSQDFPLQEKKKIKIKDSVLDISTSTNGIVILKTRNSVVALDSEAQTIKWQKKLSSSVSFFPALVSNNRVYITDTKYLWALNADTGSEMWRRELNNSDTWVVAVSSEIVLVNSVSDSIEAFDSISGEHLWKIYAGRGYTSAYIYDEIVYIIDHGVSAINAITGERLWQIGNQVTVQSAFADGFLYYEEYYDRDRIKLIALNVATRENVWSKVIPEKGMVKLYPYHKSLFVTDSETLYNLDIRNGSVLWSKSLSDSENPSVLFENVYVTEQFSKLIYSFNIETGQSNGVLRIAAPRPFDSGGRLLATSGIELIFVRGNEAFIYGN